MQAEITMDDVKAMDERDQDSHDDAMLEEHQGEQLEERLSCVEPTRLDYESQFQSWTLRGGSFVVYEGQVFAKFDATGNGDYRIAVRGEGDDEGTWTQWA